MDKYLKLQLLLENNSDRAKAQKMTAYMRNQFPFYGIDAAKRKALYKDFLMEEKSIGVIDWCFLRKCYEDSHREFQYFVADYLFYMRKFIAFQDLERIKSFICEKSWWDTVDEFSKLVGYVALKDARADELMLIWADDADMWTRRTAIIYQNCKKDKLNADLLEEIISKNLGSDEFFINKAIGWSLRDFSKVNPQWVKSFLSKYEAKMSKLSINEAKKYL